MPKLDVNGFSMFYETIGLGQPILFIPGALGTGGVDFKDQLPWFSQTFRVIAPDPRGYGESRPPERDYPLDFYQRDAEDMLALMTALGHDEFSIAGWSDGANIGVLMAAKCPERIRRLVIWVEIPTSVQKRSLLSKLCAQLRRGQNGQRLQCGRPMGNRSMPCGNNTSWAWKSFTKRVAKSIGLNST